MQRAYRDDMQCPHCGSNWLPKAGLSRGKQTYRCGECLHRFTPEGNRSYYPEEVKRQAIAMYTEGMGYSAISRVLGIKPETIYSWVKKPFNISHNPIPLPNTVGLRHPPMACICGATGCVRRNAGFCKRRKRL